MWFKALAETIRSSFSSSSPEPEYAPWERNGGFVLYLFLVVYIVLSFEILVNDFFIPALNVLCEKCHISQDFAGATLMPAGSEIPDILISIFGMLILHSDVGVGTIAGSMLFNILVIVGGCIIAVGTLQLETSVVLRDLTFFSLSLVLLLVSAVNGWVTKWEGIAFIVLYVLYVLFCFNMENFKIAYQLFRTRCLGKAGPGAEEQRLDEGLLGREDVVMNEEGGGLEMNVGDITVTVDGDGENDASTEGTGGEDDGITGPVKARSSNTARRLQQMAYKEQQLSKGPDGSSSSRIEGTLYKRCMFYAKLSLKSRVWQTRYFVLDENLWYCRSQESRDKIRFIPLWTATSIDHDKKDPTTFHIVTPTQTYTLRATDVGEARNWMAALRERLLYIHGEVDASSGKVYVPNIPPSATVDSVDDDEDASILEPPPKDASIGKKIMFYLTCPYLFAFTFTIPNVKKMRWKNWFPVTFLLVCVWLAGLVYAMVWFADRVAVVLHLPADLMGIAFTGICASLPCLFGSLVCAKQGAGGMAIANAIASNTACILLGFGLPFFIQTLMIDPVNDMPIDGESIPLTVLVLLVSVVAFLVGAIVCCMRFKRPAGIIFIIIFVVLLVTIVTLNAYDIAIKF